MVVRRVGDRFVAAALAAATIALGATLNLGNVWQTGLLGLGLGLFVAVFSGAVLFLADRLTELSL